jgi:hypothetical protein
MNAFQRRHPIERDRSVQAGDPRVSPTVSSAAEEEESAVIRDDEDETFDLGFIVEDHDDRRSDSLEHWQRLADLDTNEPLETRAAEPLPEEIEGLRAKGLPEEWYPTDARAEHVRAEQSEEEFAVANRLVADPYDESLTTIAEDERNVASDLDRDNRPESVDIRGHAPGITTGFGSSVPQDLGAGGFAIERNPLIVAARVLEYPISTARLSDEAIGARDVAEMGADAELYRLADRAARQEARPRHSKGEKAEGPRPYSISEEEVPVTAPECPHHHQPMELVPAEPRARCVACGYLTEHLRFERCPECGHRLHIEEPEPHWHCPACAPVTRTAEKHQSG